MTEDKQREELGRGIYAWWEGLKKDKGSKARLKRADTIIKVELEGSFHELMSMTGQPFNSMDQMAAVAMVLSHVDEGSDKSLAVLMGKKAKSKDHAVSELRFRKIIDSEREDAIRQVIRVLPMVDSRASITKLGLDIFYWGDRVKKEWMYEYYNKSEERGN